MVYQPLLDFIKKIELKTNCERRIRITNKLAQLECNYCVQTYPFEFSEDEGHNIIVQFGNTGEKIIVGAHYDVADGSGGANDNGSGVSVLLGFIQRCLEEGIQHQHTIEVVFFDHEETPESGAKYYVKNSQQENIKGMFNLDICGMGDTIIYDDKRNPDISIVQAVKNTLEFHRYDNVVMHDLPASDERQFEEAGIPNLQIGVIPREDVMFISKLVVTQKEVRDLISSGEITPREADKIIKTKLGGTSLPKLLRVMHTPEDLSIHLSEKTLTLVLNTITETISRYDMM
jgi:aminopeptidase YwaD